MHDIRIWGINVKRALLVPLTEGDFSLLRCRAAWREYGCDGRRYVTPRLVAIRGILTVEIDEQVLVVVAIHDPGGRQLLFVAAAHRAGGLLFGPRQGRQQHGGEDGDDRNYDQ